MQPFVYRGFYRYGKRIAFAYRLGDVEMLDAPWVENGKLAREVAPVDKHSLAHITRGGRAQWPQALTTTGALGAGRPYAVDTIVPPFKNPWRVLLFFGGHDFFPDGAAALCTMQGDVWRVDGLDASLKNVRWHRIAAGLHHALGLVISFEPHEIDVMFRPPRAVDRPIVTGFGVWRILVIGLLLLAYTLSAFFWMRSLGVSDSLARTVAVNAITIG